MGQLSEHTASEDSELPDVTSSSPFALVLLDHPFSVNSQSSPQASLSVAQSDIV